MKKTTNHKNAAPVFQVKENVSLEEQIAQRAHELWQQHGGEHRNAFFLRDSVTKL